MMVTVNMIISRHSWRAGFIVFFCLWGMQKCWAGDNGTSLVGLRALFQRKTEVYNMKSSKKGCAKCLLRDT